jgi:hypothetical protein
MDQDAELQVLPYSDGHADALRRFMLRVWPDMPMKADERFRKWHFRDNPLGDSQNLAQVMLAGDDVVGFLGALRDRLWTGSVWVDAVWILDLHIAEEYRGGASVLLLFQGVMRKSPVVLATGVAEHIIRLYQALKFRRIRASQSFVSIIRAGPLLAVEAEGGRLTGAKAFLRVFAAISDLVTPAAYRLAMALMAPSNVGTKVEPITSFDREVDELFTRLLPQLGCTTWRDARQLEWKFTQRPFGTHFAFALRRGKRMEGYVVVKVMLRRGIASWGEIVDILCDPRDKTGFDLLISAAQKECLSRNLDCVRFRCSLPEHIDRLRNPMWIRRTIPVIDEIFVYSSDREIAASLGERWHLTSLVSDRAEVGADEWPELPSLSANYQDAATDRG